MKGKVLFLCTGNSCRSQMAEGWLRHLAGDPFEAASAGTDPQKLNPLAVECMGESGVDISEQWSKSVKDFSDQSFDYVITVCDRARESCPAFSQASTVLHWSFSDPAEAEGSLEERRQVFRQVREQIKEHVSNFLRETYRVEEL